MSTSVGSVEVVVRKASGGVGAGVLASHPRRVGQPQWGGVLNTPGKIGPARHGYRMKDGAQGCAAGSSPGEKTVN